MFRDNGGPKLQPAVSGKAFDVLRALIAALPIPPSTRHNALYDDHALIAALAFVCEKGASAHAALKAMKVNSDGVGIPTGQWLLGMLGKMPHGAVEKCCREALARAVKFLIENKLVRACAVVALDFHPRPFAGKDGGGWTVGGKPKGGATKFDAYLTARIAGAPHALHVGAIRVRDGVKRADYVGEMLAELRRMGLKPKLFLADRGSCTAATMSAFDAAGEKFLVPARMTTGIKRALEEYKRGKRGRASAYTMKPDGGKQFAFWLVVEKRMRTVKGRKRLRHLTFAASAAPGAIERATGDVPGAYAQRWKIENAYKSIKQIRPMTTSKNRSIRTFLTYFAMINCNAWHVSSRAAGADAAESGGRPARGRVTLSVFMALMLGLALEIIKTDKAEREYYLQCVR